MRLKILLIALFLPGISQADSNIARERISCFQQGRQILDISDQIRKFQELNDLKQVAEINLGQVGRELVRIYSVDSGNLTCILRTHE